MLLTLGGCASGSRVPDPQLSHAREAGITSPLSQVSERLLEGRHSNDSALHLLSTGSDALAARLVLVDKATHGIDLQYYIFRADKSGAALLAALWRAADRGVRVRLLLDDWGARPDDATLQRVAAHHNIEVRLFNPLLHPQSAVLSLLLDFARTHQRMHNKLFVADGRAAIVGGRNIGDEYFSRRQEFEFSDVDVLVFGPVVRQLAEGFDRYWNDALTTAILAPASPPVDASSPAELADEPVRSAHHQRWAERLAAGELRRFAAPATAVQDLPGKLDPARPAEATELGREIARVMGPASRELLIVSPYFVPGAGGVAQLRELTGRGVRVTVVTNTLAATDVPAVHAGYARYRHALLEAGVELYEIRADAAQRDSGRGGRPGSSRLSLHAKLLVVDRSTSFIGSMNIDPRSLRLNTENGIVVASPELANTLAEGVRQALEHDAWRLYRSGHRLHWVGTQEGATVTLKQEPGAGWWLRLQALLLSWLPIEGLL